MNASRAAFAGGSIPVLLCGRHPTIASAVKTTLLPRFTVINVSHDLPSAVKDVPRLLRIKEPHTGQKPAAVIIGGAFSHDDVKQIQRAVCSTTATKWLMMDMTRAPTTRLNFQQEATLIAYGKEVGQRVVERLNAVQRFYDERDEIVLF